jgi:hypothetical protein
MKERKFTKQFSTVIPSGNVTLHPVLPVKPAHIKLALSERSRVEWEESRCYLRNRFEQLIAFVASIRVY